MGAWVVVGTAVVGTAAVGILWGAWTVGGSCSAGLDVFGGDVFKICAGGVRPG